MRFESRGEPLATRGQFGLRIAAGVGLAAGMIAVSLALGVLGYRYVAGLTNWVDCVYNASMILGGMGPVAELKTDAGKLFASAYALYSGLALLTAAGIVLGPVMHRVLHRFHLDDADLDRPPAR